MGLRRHSVAAKRIGINLYSLRDHTQEAGALRETLRRVRDMGYEGVQISGIRDLDPSAIAEAVKEIGTPVAATHMGWEQFTKDTDTVVDVHRSYGCSHTAIGSLPEDYRSLAGIRRFLDELGPVMERLRAEGMDFSYHNHNHELAHFDRVPWLGRLIEESADLGLCFEIDTYWIQAGGGDPVAWMARCTGRMPLLHLKDMIVTTAREQRFAPVGDGNLEWDEILSTAERCGVEWYLVEQDTFYGADPFTDVERSCRFLRKRLGK